MFFFRRELKRLLERTNNSVNRNKKLQQSFQCLGLQILRQQIKRKIAKH